MICFKSFANYPNPKPKYHQKCKTTTQLICLIPINNCMYYFSVWNFLMNIRHPCGKYRYNSIQIILAKELEYKNLRSKIRTHLVISNPCCINHSIQALYRLDRLTSGCVILGKNFKGNSQARTSFSRLLNFSQLAAFVLFKRLSYWTNISRKEQPSKLISVE